MAAESVVKLKLESGEYEAKIKRATAGLMQMERECRNAGGILNKLEDENRAFVKSLGNMETVSKSAKGKIAELTGAFQDLRSMYNRLSDEEKKGEFGKELNKQLGIMKGRIQEAQAEMKSINSEMGNGGNALDSLTSKFGLNIKQLAGWGMAIGAAKGALDVAQQAFFASEANLDDWNRAVYASESAWDAFLTSINTGDISGFLSRINTIVAAASQAYNELDRLSTQKAINNPAIKKQEAENERFRAMLRTGRYIAPTDGRKASMQEGQVLTDAQKKRIADQLENGTKSLNTFVKKEISQTTKAIDALYKEQSAQLGMSLKEFRSGTANMDEFDKRMAGYKKYLEYEQKNTIQTINTDGTVTTAKARNNPYEQYKAWGVFKDDGDLFGKINSLIDQRTALQSQNYSQTANAYRAINRVEGTGSSGGGRSGSGTFDTFKLQLQQFKAEIADPGFGGGIDGGALWKMLGGDISIKKLQDMKSVLQQQFDTATSEQDRLKLKADIELTEGWIKAMQAPGEWTIDENGIRIPLKFDIDKKSLAASAQVFGKLYEETYGVKDNSEKTKAAWSAAASAVQSAGGAMQSMEDPAAKVAGIVMQAIANVALGFTSGMTKEGMRGGVWGWIAASAAGLATMVSTIAAIKSATEYHAQGGIAGLGNSTFIPRGTDTIPAMLTPGETILSVSQTRNLADNISSISQTRGRGIGMITTKLRGRDMIVMINNELKAQGRPTI